MDYLFITEAGAQITYGLQLMQLFSENKDDFTKLTYNLGLYFQIFDDYFDVLEKEVNSELLVSDI
jgi:geranylgeranyl diphosphate synthase type 3